MQQAETLDRAANGALEKAGLTRLSLSVIIGLVGLAILTFGLILYFFRTYIEGAPAYLAILFAGSVLVVACLSVIVFGRIWRVWRNRRVGLAGSRMQIRLVGLLSVVAILPTFIAFFFSALVLQTVSQDFFVNRINQGADAARNVANTYFSQKAERMGDDLVRVAFDLALREETDKGLGVDPESFQKYFIGQALLRNWAAAYLLDGSGKVIAQVQQVPGIAYQLPDPTLLEGLNEEAPFNFNAQDPDKLSIYRGILKLKEYGDGYLVSYTIENPDMTQGLLAVRDFRDSTISFKDRLGDLSRVFTMGYALLALIILLLAVWAGLLVANAIVSPIGRLAAAAEKISAGDLTERVLIREGDGELGDLAQTFNRMTEQLQTQRDDLIAANRQADDRRRFTETVLSGVSAGVIGVAQTGRITLANKTAADFLHLPSGRMMSAQLRDVAPELNDLFDKALGEKSGDVQGQMELVRDGQTRILNVRIGRSKTEDVINYVVTFDDISQLISAQRNAAWGDVARRIAHEIKNPLTPIQLSAERLKRKYGPEITSSPEIFERCTDTIIRHVNDIGRMVNEFSSFARMPEPVMNKEIIREIVKNAIFPFQVAHPDVEYTVEHPEQAIIAQCDGRLLVQACTNLIKNATESIEEERKERNSTEPGRIFVRVSETTHEVTITVHDNGRGLPDQARHLLTEPYMTTREKGTGLGLAIVRKVIEEHGGALHLRNDKSLGERGAAVSLAFPKQFVTDPDNKTIMRDERNGQDRRMQENA